MPNHTPSAPEKLRITERIKEEVNILCSILSSATRIRQTLVGSKFDVDCKDEEKEPESVEEILDAHSSLFNRIIQELDEIERRL